MTLIPKFIIISNLDENQNSTTGAIIMCEGASNWYASEMMAKSGNSEIFEDTVI